MGKPWHSPAVLMALLALLLQLAVPLWHMPPAMAAAMLCQAHMAPVGRDAPADPAVPQPGKSCPICQVAHATGTGVPPAPTAIAVPVEFSLVVFLPPADARVVHPAAPPPANRGPPAA